MQEHDSENFNLMWVKEKNPNNSRFVCLEFGACIIALIYVAEGCWAPNPRFI